MTSYTTITELSELDEVLARSYDVPVVIFKHSLTCGVSSAALRGVMELLARPDHRVVEIQRSRELSQEIARRTGIRHQSPQALVLRNGKVTWNASHWSITEKKLEAAMEAAARSSQSPKRA